jgi:hypothetical protein
VLGRGPARRPPPTGITPKPPYEVRQYGLRKLWDEVETAYRWWTDISEPTVNAWTFTITPSGHQIELR